MDDSAPVSPDAEDLHDAHGHVASDYDWRPVLRKPRKDGWSPAKQRRFVEWLADTGSVIVAARAVGMSENSCYRLRRSPGAENFAAAWRAAIDVAAARLIDVAFDRAVNGSKEAIYNRDGECVAERTRHHDRLLMFLLRSFDPNRFGDKARVAPEHEVSIEALLRRLEPAPPADPAARMAPEDLETALLTADILDGKLPHWLRERGDDDDDADDHGGERGDDESHAFG